MLLGGREKRAPAVGSAPGLGKENNEFPEATEEACERGEGSQQQAPERGDEKHSLNLSVSRQGLDDGRF